MAGKTNGPASGRGRLENCQALADRSKPLRPSAYLTDFPKSSLALARVRHALVLEGLADHSTQGGMRGPVARPQ